MKHLLQILLFSMVVLMFTECKQSVQKNDIPYKPNIVWIVVEDMSEHWSCYGETTILTPNIDKLASEGELFENAFVSAPVCSPSRSAMITGMYQTTSGAHNHRSQIEEGKGGGNTAYFGSYQLPDEIPFLPKLFKEAGYYTVLGNEKSIINNQNRGGDLGKTDYNFEWDPIWYDSNDWERRQSGQPFFAQVQLRGGKYRNAQPENAVNPADVKLPPYYPDDTIMRKDWAEYLNSVLHLDIEVKKILERLEEEGIADSTAVFLFTDHGISHLRGKQFLYDDGIKIPMVVRWPEVTQRGKRRKDLVSQIDISTTSLYLAGIPIPKVMQGQSLYGENYVQREYIYSARDRCDETVDLIRAIRTDKFKYIRNFLPHKSHAQPSTYKDGKEIIRHMRQLYAENGLKKETTRYFEPTRQTEELYDLEKDPWEMNNLAVDPVYQDTLQKMQDMLLSNIFMTNDLGFIPEPILEDLGRQYENKFYVLQQNGNRDLTRECIETMELAEKNDVGSLQRALNHERASVRFWAAYGLGNIPELPTAVVPMLQNVLNDDSDVVKIAAARALCRIGREKPGLRILEDNLENQNLIVGLYAALFIEDLDEESIRKVLPAIEEAKESPYEFTRRTARRLSENFSEMRQWN